MTRLGRLAALCVAIGVATATGVVTARPAPPPPAKTTEPAPPPVVKGTAEGGVHWRLETAKGPIHVWQPPGYRHATAGIALYAHGFGTKVDGAWKDHALAKQFAESKRNALFIVPEVRSGSRDRLRWTDLGALLRTVETMTNAPRPLGEIVAVGHSGAFRTMARWLDYGGLDTVIMLDGLYGAQPDYGAWLRRNKRHRLIMTSCDTFERSEPFARTHHAVTFGLLPERPEDVTSTARTAQLVYYRAQFSHMELVENGQVIPVLLSLTTLPSR